MNSACNLPYLTYLEEVWKNNAWEKSQQNPNLPSIQTESSIPGGGDLGIQPIGLVGGTIPTAIIQMDWLIPVSFRWARTLPG